LSPDEARRLLKYVIGEEEEVRRTIRISFFFLDLPFFLAVVVLTVSQATTPFPSDETNPLLAGTAQIALPVGGQFAFVDTGDLSEEQENPRLSTA
jgi:hypothetical protein